MDAMRSSSPPHKLPTVPLNYEDRQSESDDSFVAYRSWKLVYPSALDYFGYIRKCAKGKRIALFLDYDGTLSPIVDDPERAFMSGSMRSAIKNVAKYFPTAKISGRSCDKVQQFVGLTELYYAGSHGIDIVGPGRHYDHPNRSKSTDKGKVVNHFQPASEFIPMIDEVFRSFVESTKHITGAKVENNEFCVSVHYRNVDEKSWEAVAQCVNDIIKNYPRLRLTHGRKVLEVRPVIDWNKGKAVEFLFESLGLENCDDVLPIYIGDDRTDENALKVLRKRNRGYGILVSPVPKRSDAHYSLRDPSEALVNVGCELAKLVPGKVSTEVDPRFAYGTHGIVRKVHELLKLYNEVEVPQERLLFKIPSTWQGIEASRLLEAEGIQTHLTFVYSFPQAAAAAQAGASVIQIFIGLVRDWARNHSGDPEIEAATKRGEDPGLALVTKAYNYIHKYGNKSKLMAAAVRNKQDLFSLLGVDYIIAPLKIMRSLKASVTSPEEKYAFVRRLSPNSAMEYQFRDEELVKRDQLTFASAMGPAAEELLGSGLEGLRKSSQTT